MKRAFNATVWLGASAVIAMVLGLLNAKLWSRWGGTLGYGHLSALYSFACTIALVCDLGASVLMVRESATGDDADQTPHTHRRMALWLVRSAGAVALIGFVLFRDLIVERVFSGTITRTDLMWIAVTTIGSIEITTRQSFINARQKVRASALTSIIGNTAGTLLPIATIAFIGFSMDVIAPALALGTVVRWLAFVVADVTLWGWQTRGARPTPKAMMHMARAASPIFLASLVGPGVMAAMPLVLLHALNQDAVGQYQAASVIVVSSLTFLAASLGQDFYPRISRLLTEPERLDAALQEQHRLVMLLAIPVLLWMRICVEPAIPIVFSPQFSEVIRILDGQLAGELMRFSCAVFVFLLLAHGGRALLVSTLVQGVSLIIATLLLAPRWHLLGVGLAFTVSYVIQFVTTLWVVRRKANVGPNASNMLLLASGMTAIALLPVMPIALRIAVALAFSTFSIVTLRTALRTA